MELTKDKDSDKCDSAEEWIVRVDRGGLWYVKNTAYLLFVVIEEEVRKCLKQLLTGSGHKSTIIKSVVESEEVEFYWLITQADFDVGDEETYKLLLHKIVELYVTVRGHSYASSLIEKHKQAMAKGTQRATNITTPMEGEEFNITEGSNGSITCTATGYPVPTVVWQNSDGSSLSNNRLVSVSPVISPTGVGNVSSVSVELMVIGAMRVDSGMYRCSANNSVNSTTRNITITVQCK